MNISLHSLVIQWVGIHERRVPSHRESPRFGEVVARESQRVYPQIAGFCESRGRDGKNFVIHGNFFRPP